MINKSQNHLKEAKETYLEHMKNAFKISFGMIGGGFKGVIHALVPGLFVTATSNRIKKLYQFIQNRDREKEK